MNGWYGLVAFVIGWILAQLWKFIVGLVKGRGQQALKNFKTAIDYVTRSGGMPSGHSASMAALTTYIGFASGFDSGLFALAVATTIIIFYDAVHVRYAVGQQGKALDGLLQQEKKATLPIVEGHTVPQACVGIALGIVVGWLVFYVT